MNRIQIPESYGSRKKRKKMGRILRRNIINVMEESDSPKGNPSATKLNPEVF